MIQFSLLNSIKRAVFLPAVFILSHGGIHKDLQFLCGPMGGIL